MAGEKLARRDLMARVGHLAQVGGLRRVQALEGVEAGLEIIELRTGGGLEVDILPSRGLDLGATQFAGQSLCWLSAAGFAHPGLVETSPQEGFLRAFGGGLLTTCGLSNVGGPNEDQGTTYRQHGRASATPAYEVAAWGEWQDEDYLFTVRGKTREAVLYGDKLEKTRTIQARLGQSTLYLQDEVENMGGTPAALLLLYHFNLGWPLVSPTSHLEAPSRGQTWPIGTPSDWKRFPEPRADYPVAVLEHQMEPDADGWVRLAVSSPQATFQLAYEAATLPRFTQWQQFGWGDYVLGLEPGNVGVMGRASERATGGLTYLQPGEKRRFRLEISVLRN